MKEAGAEQSELVLFLHGGPGTPDYLNEVTALLQHQFRVVSFDQRGTGRSVATNHSYSLAEYLADIRAVAGYFGQTSFHVFGHSWGGLLAQYYGLAYPHHVRSLFLCNPVPGPGWQWMQMIAEESLYIVRRAHWPDLKKIILAYWQGQFSRTRADEGWQQFYSIVWRYYFAEPARVPVLDPAWIKGIRTEPIRETVKTILSASVIMLDAGPQPVGFPVGIMYGADDFLQRSRKPTLKRFPGSHFYEIQGAGHVPWVDNQADFHRSLLDFYAKPPGAD